MLRKVLLGFACVLAISGVFGLLEGETHAWPMAFWGLMLVLAIVFERWRYSPRDELSTGEWQETEERFVDSESGRLMQVFYQPTTGERQYVPAGGVADSGN